MFKLKASAEPESGFLRSSRAESISCLFHNPAFLRIPCLVLRVLWCRIALASLPQESLCDGIHGLAR